MILSALHGVPDSLNEHQYQSSAFTIYNARFQEFTLKHVIGLLFITLLSSPVLANTTPLMPQRHSIVGTWIFPVSGTNCAETYHFYSNGTTKVTSGEEVSESRYEISLMPSMRGYYKFVDTITKNNGKKDCSGEVTKIGDKATNFIRFHPSDQMFIMCQTESLDSCFGPLRRTHE